MTIIKDKLDKHARGEITADFVMTEMTFASYKGKQGFKDLVYKPFTAQWIVRVEDEDVSTCDSLHKAMEDYSGWNLD